MGESRAQTTEIMLKEHCHADSCFEQKSSAIDITGTFEKLFTVAFNRKFEYDTFMEMKIILYMFCRGMSKLQHIKIWEKIDHRRAK